MSRPKEGETAEIEDSYAYDGQGLRASQTIGGTTAYLVWDFAEKLPLILDDGTNSYIYGPGGLPIEQVNDGSGAVLYLHHDEQGSTRLLTGSGGAQEASFTYNAYGNQIGHTGTATTPLGYDGQYTDGDTGLIYLRARYYDPGTGQFISNDPQVMETRAPYAFADDDPLLMGDPTGTRPWSPRIKQAVARCQAWKNWHSQNSPYYHKQHGKSLIYDACNDLLHLPSEVYGTSSSTDGSVGKAIADLVGGAATLASGVVALVGCGVGEGAAGLEGLMVEGHCAQAGIGVIALGGTVFARGLYELHEQIP